VIIEPFCAYLVHFGAQWDSRISRSQRSRWSNISALYDIQSLWVASKSCYVFCVPHTCSVDCGILLKGQYLSDPRDAGTSTRTSTSKKQTKKRVIQHNLLPSLVCEMALAHWQEGTDRRWVLSHDDGLMGPKWAPNSTNMPRIQVPSKVEPSFSDLSITFRFTTVFLPYH
jgi:hypothetical protein